MKVKVKNKLPPVTKPPLSAKHKFNRCDVLHLGLDTITITQVDYSAGEVYYSVSYKRKGAKRPRWGWVLAALLDDLIVTKTDKARPHKQAAWRHEEEEDNEEPTVRIVK